MNLNEKTLLECVKTLREVSPNKLLLDVSLNKHMIQMLICDINVICTCHTQCALCWTHSSLQDHHHILPPAH